MNNKKCSTKYCRNKRGKGHLVCHKCRNRKYRKNNPLIYIFHNLKNNAKTRGKEFTLTIEQFKKFCEQTNYLDKRGINGGSATIDRINESIGYVDGNLQVLTLSENIRKYYVHYGNNFKTVQFGF